MGCLAAPHFLTSPRYCQAAYCDSDKGRRPQLARFPWDGRPRGKTPPGYVVATARLTPWACLDATAHWRQDTDALGPTSQAIGAFGQFI